MHTRLAAALTALGITGGALAATIPAASAGTVWKSGGCSASAVGVKIHASGSAEIIGTHLRTVAEHADDVTTVPVNAQPKVNVYLRHANGVTYRHWYGETADYRPVDVALTRGDYLAYVVKWAVTWAPDAHCNYYLHAR